MLGARFKRYVRVKSYLASNKSNQMSVKY